MDSLSIKGKLIKKLNPDSGISKEGRGWKKQNFIVDTGSKFNSEICFQVFGEERIQMLNNFNLNDDIEVSFNLYSKEFNNRYFHNIDAWKILKSNPEQDQKEEEIDNPF